MEEHELSNSVPSGPRRSRELATSAPLPTPITLGMPSDAALREHQRRNEEHVTRLQQFLAMRVADRG